MSRISDVTCPSKIAAERVRQLAASLDDPDATNRRLGRQPFRVYPEQWFTARPVMPSTKEVRSCPDSQLLPAFGASRRGEGHRDRILANDPDADVDDVSLLIVD